jgi:hypothetical protein
MCTDTRLTTLEQAMTELALAQARTQANLDRLSDEMRAFKEESRQASRDADRRLGELSNRMGTLAEDIVAPSVPACFEKLFGIEKPGWIVRATMRHRDDPGRMREFDVVAWGGHVFLVNETKSRLRPEDIEPFVASLPEVRAYFRETEGRRIVGSFASFHLDSTLVLAAERAGLFVFGLGSGLLEQLNSPGFKPRES